MKKAYKCSLTGSTDATNDISRYVEMKRAGLHSGTPEESQRRRFDSCTGLYTDCGTPLLSSIPVVRSLFPRTCLKSSDVVEWDEFYKKPSTYSLLSDGVAEPIRSMGECEHAAKALTGKSDTRVRYNRSSNSSDPSGCILSREKGEFVYNPPRSNSAPCNARQQCVIQNDPGEPNSVVTADDMTWSPLEDYDPQECTSSCSIQNLMDGNCDSTQIMDVPITARTYKTSPSECAKTCTERADCKSFNSWPAKMNLFGMKSEGNCQFFSTPTCVPRCGKFGQSIESVCGSNRKVEGSMAYVKRM